MTTVTYYKPTPVEEWKEMGVRGIKTWVMCWYLLNVSNKYGCVMHKSKAYHNLKIVNFKIQKGMKSTSKHYFKM